MADFVNPSTLEVVASVNDMPAPWQVCTRAQVEAALAIPREFRTWDGSAIVEMSAAEKFPLIKAARIRALVAEVNRVGGINYPPETEARLRCMREEAYRRGLANRAAYIETGFAWQDTMLAVYIQRRALLAAAGDLAALDAVSLDLSSFEPTDPAVSVTSALMMGD